MPCDDPGVVNRSKAPVHRGFRPDWTGLRPPALTLRALCPHPRTVPHAIPRGRFRRPGRSSRRPARGCFPRGSDGCRYSAGASTGSVFGRCRSRPAGGTPVARPPLRGGLRRPTENARTCPRLTCVDARRGIAPAGRPGSRGLHPAAPVSCRCARPLHPPDRRVRPPRPPAVAFSRLILPAAPSPAARSGRPNPPLGPPPSACRLPPAARGRCPRRGARRPQAKARSPKP